MFVGYGRSGHSFIGSALDAHPNICITHEADAVRRSESEFLTRDDLFEALKRHSEEIARGGRLTHNRWGDPYEQSMEGQIKPDATLIKVLGNKNGSVETGNDSQIFKDRLSRFEQFLGTGIKVKLLMVLRNPFDAGLFDEGVFSLLQWVSDEYRDRCHVVRHEEFVGDLSSQLTRLCAFVEVPAYDRYIQIVQQKTFKNPHRSRYRIDYTEEDKRCIQERIDRYSLFAGYRYDS